MEKGKLHLVSQEDQPMFSTRKCCEKCGVGLQWFGSKDRYCNTSDNYTKKVADKENLVLCSSH